MIQVSVGLPLFNSKYIAWLALESLCRQKLGNKFNIDLNWELLIEEEQNDLMFGWENIKKYDERLKNAGCLRIEYEPLQSWIPLPEKWVNLCKKTSLDSELFILQAADCYSQPYRLIDSYKIFKSYNCDWIASQIGPFYIIVKDQVILFDTRATPMPTALNMAIRTSLLKQISPSSRKSGVDGWMFEQATKINKKPLVVGYNNSEHWKLGIDTHGLNNISLGRYKHMSRKRHIYHGSIDLKGNIPDEILAKLKECKKYCKRIK